MPPSDPQPLPESAAPLSTAPSVHDILSPRQTVVSDDFRPDDGVAKKAEQERHDAMYKVHEWQRWVLGDPKAKMESLQSNHWETYALEEYTGAREGLFHRLCEADVPLPPLKELQNLDAFFPAAVKLLYLCSHKPEEFRDLRGDTGRFLEAIDAWGNVNVPREKRGEAVTLALRIHNDANKTQAIAKGGKASGEGN